MKQAPRHQVVYKYLKKMIISGSLNEGTLLPSENELCNQFEVTRPTVRQALNTLVQEGYIYKHHGKGSIVASQRRTLGLLSFRGFSEVLKETAEPVQTRVLEGAVKQDWPEDFFYPLAKNILQAGCYFIKRLRLVGANPVMLEYTWLPDIDLPDFAQISFEKNSLFSTLGSHYHIEVTSVDQQVRAIQANAEMAFQLGVVEGTALLHIYRKYGTSRNGFYLFSSLLCNTEKYSIGNIFK
jgi:DNA-binding GntR family transcriptional regulator